LDILEFFLYFFIVPLVFLSCIGLISADTVNLIKKNIDEAKKLAKQKIEEAAKNAKPEPEPDDKQEKADPTP